MVRVLIVVFGFGPLDFLFFFWNKGLGLCLSFIVFIWFAQYGLRPLGVVGLALWLFLGFNVLGLALGCLWACPIRPLISSTLGRSPT